MSLAAVAAATLFVLVVALQPWAEPHLMFMDMIAAAEASGYCCRGYYGAVSQLGVMAWFLTAGVLLLAALCVATSGGRCGLLAFAAVFSTLLGADDGLLLHESMLPGIGVPQFVVVGIYGLIALAYAWLQRHRMMMLDGAFLLLAFTLFALSLGIDQVLHTTDGHVVAVEDGLKFVGIVSWLAFHLDWAWRTVSGIARPAPVS
ncbi:hypothetical protein GCM10009116_19320 [Brevundimonas basaltis]